MYLKKQFLNHYLLSFSIGIVYLWFGLLKFFPEYSPAEELAKNTIQMLTFAIIPTNVSIILLAIWETIIGILLIVNIKMKLAVKLALVQMLCTFLPFLFFPKEAFSIAPFGFTLLGQYIFKNIIIIAALFTIYFQSENRPEEHVDLN